MSIVHQVLSLPDLEEVYSYATRRLQLSEPNDQDRIFKSWSAKWRRESLEHYLKLGWSFIARDEQRLDGQGRPEAVGFFLAQPFLFFRGQTQTLWVEHVEADDVKIETVLVDIAVRVAREKHLQRVLFGESDALTESLKPWPATPLELEEKISVVKTTKG